MAAPKKLSRVHRRLFCRYLGYREHTASVYAFENIHLWKGLYEISWSVVDKNLCVFFRDKFGCFLYLPPLGRCLSLEALEYAFKVMDSYNRLPEISRIENCEEEELSFFRQFPRYRIDQTNREYLYRRADLAGLKGQLYKGKRSSVNYFLKHTTFDCRPFRIADAGECERLFRAWMRQRQRIHTDRLYQGLMKDSYRSLRWLFARFKEVSYPGIVVRVDGEIKAFSLGYPLNREIFCVLFEVADLSIKGLAQFIFRRFCRELEGFSYINAMDDSGLDNLARAKLSYKPQRVLKIYNVKRAD